MYCKIMGVGEEVKKKKKANVYEVLTLCQTHRSNNKTQTT